VKQFTWQAAPDGGGTLGLEVEDAEGDRAMAIWGQRLDQGQADRAGFQVADAAVRAEWQADALVLQAATNIALCRVAGLGLTNVQRWAVRLRIPSCPNSDSRPAAGLAFNIRSPRSFDGFGWLGAPSCWSFVRVVDGVIQRVVSRGAPGTPGAWVDIAVYRVPGGGLEAEVAGQPLCRWLEGAWDEGGAGLFTGAEESAFQRVAICPPTRADLVLTEQGLQLKPGADLASLFLRLSDGRAAREVPARRPD
jgi:hypothetical protein